MNNKGRSEAETIFGLGVFVIIMAILVTGGIFTTIIKSFNQAFVGGFGLFLGILFVLLIIVAFLEKILGK